SSRDWQRPPFAVTGSAEGEGFTWYFGPSHHETAALEVTSRSAVIADQLRELRRRLQRNSDPRLAALRDAVKECVQVLQCAGRPLRDRNERTLEGRAHIEDCSECSVSS